MMKFNWSLIKNLRKSIIFLVVLVILLSAKRGYEDFVEPTSVNQSQEDHFEQDREAELILCKKIIQSKPLGRITHFAENSKRLFLYFKHGLTGEDLYVNWYENGEKVTSSRCPIENEICISSISPKIAKQGSWSVDVIQSNYLIVSQQFEVR